MRRDISLPISAPTRPYFLEKLSIVDLRRDMQSSSGTGAGHVRMSLIQVSAISGAPDFRDNGDGIASQRYHDEPCGVSGFPRTESRNP
ncbi:hypothetical protein QE369_001103 [Agrobacterium larrymoorei]|uniref:Uncharacterized protein n=1 Tax=Agrobacterium larrymoorei TaxID=160699 RepID=A0AAJ2BJR6_9HYPH|nr:hypothetical protein [Agrobacterium larrymoorei]